MKELIEIITKDVKNYNDKFYIKDLFDYNFNYAVYGLGIEDVKYIKDILRKYNIKSFRTTSGNLKPFKILSFKL